jgi:hypothetical protein
MIKNSAKSTKAITSLMLRLIQQVCVVSDPHEACRSASPNHLAGVQVEQDCSAGVVNSLSC